MKKDFACIGDLAKGDGFYIKDRENEMHKIMIVYEGLHIKYKNQKYDDPEIDFFLFTPRNHYEIQRNEDPGNGNHLKLVRGGRDDTILIIPYNSKSEEDFIELIYNGTSRNNKRMPPIKLSITAPILEYPILKKDLFEKVVSGTQGGLDEVLRQINNRTFKLKNGN